jgi:hypothetical protein
MPAKNNATTENQSVGRALRILSLLAESQEPLGARDSSAPWCSTEHCPATHPHNGQQWLRQQTDSTLRYLVGYKAFQVGNAFVGHNNLYSVVMPELNGFADQYVNGFLGVRCDQALGVSGDGAKQRPNSHDA